MLQTTPSASVPVTFFRPRRGGPECEIEDRVIHHLPVLFCSAHPAWMAGSVPLGAGLPDLIVATYQALVAGLAEAGAVETNILAYLRVVSRAKPDTIATRLRLSPKIAEHCVRRLLEAKVITKFRGFRCTDADLSQPTSGGHCDRSQGQQLAARPEPSAPKPDLRPSIVYRPSS